MARARKRRAPNWIVWVALLTALGAGAWCLMQRPASTTQPRHDMPVVSAEHVDPTNEGREISVEGKITVAKAARDPQLGITADAVTLLRKVEMLQWRETCSGSCEYALDWSETPIDSSGFRDAGAHANTTSFPFSSERFAGGDMHLGAFKIDSLDVSAIEPGAISAFPVRVSQLPPNLAATFRDRDGMLYAGADPAHASAGDLRVSYRAIMPGQLRVVGVQQGDHLNSPQAR